MEIHQEKRGEELGRAKLSGYQRLVFCVWVKVDGWGEAGDAAEKEACGYRLKSLGHKARGS